jgi:hypothetical protein
MPSTLKILKQTNLAEWSNRLTDIFSELEQGRIEDLSVTDRKIVNDVEKLEKELSKYLQSFLLGHPSIKLVLSSKKPNLGSIEKDNTWYAFLTRLQDILGLYILSKESVDEYWTSIAFFAITKQCVRIFEEDPQIAEDCVQAFGITIGWKLLDRMGIEVVAIPIARWTPTPVEEFDWDSTDLELIPAIREELHLWETLELSPQEGIKRSLKIHEFILLRTCLEWWDKVGRPEEFEDLPRLMKTMQRTWNSIKDYLYFIATQELNYSESVFPDSFWKPELEWFKTASRKVLQKRISELKEWLERVRLANYLLSLGILSYFLSADKIGEEEGN